jgi:cytochrome c553
MKHMNILTLVTVLGMATALPAAAIDSSPEMGKGLYMQSGANSCVYCHGENGVGGKVAAAAKLNVPKTWKTFKALGGEAALKKDKAGFLKNMEEAVEDLIMTGAIAHNMTFKKPYFDWKALGGTFDAQMLGLTGAPSKAWLAKYKERGVTKEIAAKSAYLYVQTLDTQGVFK